VVSFFLPYSVDLFPASLLLRALIPPYYLVEMISKSFPILASIALLIIASRSPVNAAATGAARQFLFLDLVD
jgi:hypothetical protein